MRKAVGIDLGGLLSFVSDITVVMPTRPISKVPTHEWFDTGLLKYICARLEIKE